MNRSSTSPTAFRICFLIYSASIWELKDLNARGLNRLPRDFNTEPKLDLLIIVIIFLIIELLQIKIINNY